eukprot:TRINITY_DN25629_c0_g1_i4.p1 TRINITY_DN25629_c0_g1~~TRINITY_DN25629_c0_g1_i4.p1  ORF type:complete len:732 (+),score=240.79 TRINITY_DN25629_c0_g1_i4:253-2448(+)
MERERRAKAREGYKGSVDDKRFSEFMEVSQARVKKTLWSNDTGVKVAETVPNRRPGGQGLCVERTRIKFAEGEEKEEDIEQDEEDTDDEEYEDVKPGSSARRVDDTMDDMEYLKSKMTDDFSDFSEDEDEDDDVSGENDSGEDEPVAVEEKAEKPKTKKKKVKSLLSDDDDDSDDQEEEEEEESAQKKHSKPVDEEEEELGESGRLFIRNLSYDVTEDELSKLCGKHGSVAEVHIPIDSISKKCKGIAYVLFMMPAHAVVAQKKLDGTIFQGRLIHVLPARAKRAKKSEGLGDQKSSFKAAKEQEMRANASSEHNWNSLFLNQDAVVESMQDSYGLAKSEILDPESSNMAVRVALGETHAIAATKAFLEEQGVDVSAFTSDGAKLQPRSKTVIMIKNLPPETNEQELRQLFSKHGPLDRLVLAPSNVLALVEYLEPTEARSGFSSLAYTRYKHSPLYLEWAPKNSFKKKSKSGNKSNPEVANPKDDEAKVPAIEKDADDTDTCTLYVTNLSFDSTEASLLAAVKKKAKGVRAVTIATKANPKGGSSLSRGFGFLEFKTRDEAASALLNMQGMEVDGHSIKLKMSTRTSAQQSGSEKKARKAKDSGKGKRSDTKVIVRNVPFEATKKEIQQLFHAFGQVKTVRLPRKFDGSHRGFAFVDFLSKEEAKEAVESLAGTHLYGRHLVIEQAELDESMDLIRDKAKRDLDSAHKHEARPVKKKKTKVGVEDMMDED